MGYRTVVMLNNDYCTEWENDPELGRKIYRGAALVGRTSHINDNPLGELRQCC